MPEDDKDARALNELKTARVRSEGYKAPREQSGVGSAAWEEQDIGYHNRYGADEGEGTRGPLESERVDMGYHNRFFRD